MKPLRLRFDVAVDDLRRARAFYGRLFRVTAKGRTIRIGRNVVLELIDETQTFLAPDPFYDRGRTPRLEWRVDDVAAWVSRAVAAGATVRCKLTPGPDGVLRDATNDEATIEYAHVIDPFGHLWAFAREPPGSVTD